MTVPTVLIVDDNAITRKVVRVTLTAEGYRVREAEDGATALAEVSRELPDLILQDLMLPDISGIDLVARLRVLPGASDIPILAFSGFQPAAAKARTIAAGFTDYLFKPVEPSVLVRTVGRYLKVHYPSSPKSTIHLRVLVADDDPIQLKLYALHLAGAGFEVSTAPDGEAALQAARMDPPDLIVSDVLMPGLDGFRLCLAVNADARLTHIPVILQTAAFTEAADRALALSIGAAGYVLGTPDSEELLAAISRCLSAGPRLPSPPRAPLNLDAYTQRIIHQVERLVSINTRLSGRVGWLESERAIVGGLADVLRGEPSAETIVDELLYRFVDAAGISYGLAYLVESDGTLAPRSRIGLAELSEETVRTFFGQSELLADVIRRGTALVLPSEHVPAEGARGVLDGLGAESAIIVPLGARHEQLGVIALASEHERFDEDWRVFAEAVGVVIGQSIGLARTVAQLRESEEQYRRIVETTSEGIWTVDANDRTTYVNQQLADMLGYRVDEIIGVSLYQFMTVEDAAVARAIVGRRPDGVDEQLEFRFQRKDGSEVQTWLRMNPLRAENGTYEGALATVTDVTTRKSLEAQLQRAQKMEAIGQLAGGVAHDFNNLLTAINGFSELLVDRTKLNSQQREYVAQIRHAGDSAAGLTRQLLAFSRQQIITPRDVDLNATVASLSRMLQRIIGEDVALSVVLAPNLGTIRADPGQIEQILLNLATNARDAMSHGGCLSIETANADLDAEFVSQHADTKPGPHVVLAVSDQGVGMDAALRSRMFEPFFTTKEIGKGTGLGLAAVHGIVKQNGGSITVASQVGVGTTIKVYFPGVAAPASASEEVTQPAEQPGGTETILVVEDDARLRVLARSALEGTGYTILEAGDGEDALLVAKRHAGTIHLLLTDVVMPKLGGRVLAERLSAKYPAMKVIFVSGHTDDIVVRHGVVNATVEFLQKPFSPRSLGNKIRQVLDAS